MTAVTEEAVAPQAEIEEEAPESVEDEVVLHQPIEIDRRLLADIDTSEKPVFTVKEMAMFFFARSSHWIRWLEQTGQMRIEEEDGTQRKVGTRRTEGGARIYTLSDVEEVAHALAQNGAISGIRLMQTLSLLRIQAEMYEYL